MSTPVFSDNCEVCGEERLSIELMPIRLGKQSFSRIKTCLGCLIHNDALGDFKDSAKMIIEALRDAATPIE